MCIEKSKVVINVDLDNFCDIGLQISRVNKDTFFNPSKIIRFENLKTWFSGFRDFRPILWVQACQIKSQKSIFSIWIDKMVHLWAIL